MSDHQWYYTQGSQRIGPVSGEVLSNLANAGTLTPNDLVWCQAMSDWAAAATVPGLFNSAAVAASTGYPNAEPMNYYTPRQTQAYYAGFWMRFAAAIIDGLILAVGGGVLGAIVGGVIGGVMGSSGSSINEIQVVAQIAGYIISVILGWLYEALMESSAKQATLGKLAVGIKVTDMLGARISFGRASGRHFGKIVSGLICGIGYFMAGFTDKKQALHDSMADCLVVRK